MNLKNIVSAAAFLIAASQLQGCIPLAVGYWAYEYGKSEDRESRATVMVECVKQGDAAKNNPICEKYLHEERQASE